MSATAPEESFTPPRAPEVPPPRRFPLVATLAPIIASAVIFAVTRSPFTLVFALLGPVVAVASPADAAPRRRFGRHREEARFFAELAAADLEVDAVHAAERELALRRHPHAVALCARPFAWHGGVQEVSVATVRVGLGETTSRLARRSPAAAGSAAASELERLWARAGRVPRYPVTVDAARGIGIVGPAAPAVAVARSILLQLAAGRSPDALRFSAPPGSDWEWMDQLPHPVTRTSADGWTSVTVIAVAAGAREKPSTVVATAPDRHGLPQGLAIILELAPDWDLLIDTPGESARRCRPDFVSAEQALASAGQLRAAARLVGGGSPTSAGLPDEIRFADLEQHAAASGLAATIGRDSDGPVAIDLRADGPHAIIGGTTGSGKSELLVTWVLAMAATRSPAEVTFLFVDFKGGAAFDPLLELPHCVGLITDLDAEQSLRALASLGAELRRRERLLAGLSLRSIDESHEQPPFARLVVVVDEYAALLETHSSLHAVFADIAARGRSLGVHLVLCTQRPAGVVRDSILANCALRVLLRVMAPADSTAVLGTDAAANLPSRPIGRALVSVAGEPARMLQVARSERSDCHVVADRWGGSARPLAPWLPPLPPVVQIEQGHAAEVADDFPFALADLPEEQAQRPSRYRPVEHGSLLVVGAAGTGKSGVLSTLASVPSTIRTTRLPRALPQLWDALHEILGQRTGEERLLLVDDLDAIIASCDESYRTALLDLVGELLRDGGADGIRLAITVQRITGALQSVLALCGSVLVLRMPSRQEHVLAGGAAGEFSETLPPGGGHWRGHRVQVYVSEAAAETPPPLAATLVHPATAAIAVVSTRPESLAGQLRRSAPLRRVVVLGSPRFGATSAMGVNPDGLDLSLGGAPDILVSDPEGWQSQWTMLGALMRSRGLLFDGCSLAEVRTLTRSRELPPPFPRGERALWLRSPDGAIVRARLPREPGHESGETTD